MIDRPLNLGHSAFGSKTYHAQRAGLEKQRGRLQIEECEAEDDPARYIIRIHRSSTMFRLQALFRVVRHAWLDSSAMGTLNGTPCLPGESGRVPRSSSSLPLSPFLSLFYLLLPLFFFLSFFHSIFFHSLFFSPLFRR